MSSNDDVTTPDPAHEPWWAAPEGTPVTQNQGSPELAAEATQASVPGADAVTGEALGTGAPTQPLSVAPSQAQAPRTALLQTPQGYRFMPPGHHQAQGPVAPQQQGQPATGYSPLGVPAGVAASADAQGVGGGQPPFTPYDRSQSSAPAAGSGASGERRRGPGWGGVVAATLAAALLASGGTVAGVRYLDAQSTSGTSVTSQPAAVATGSTTKTVSSTGTAPDWEAVTAAVSSSVVAIAVDTDQGSAVGSGVVYDSSGHIMTNNHVISGATQIQVTLADGRIYEAELTGTDPATDLAVIQLKNAPSDLTVAQLGDSEALVTGQDVMAIGNPLGLSSTATTGIVSALNRPVVTTQEESQGSQSQGSAPGLSQGQSQASASQVCTNAIQIDAAVNPGNSGGPLFDETGKVIGITSSIASMSSSSGESGSIGIGFAIPVNLARKVADQLIATGTATHAYLGVSIGDGGGEVDGVTRAGAQIGTVESGSPAQKAGIAKGDVVTAIDGKATTQAAALTGFVRQYSAGDTVTLTVIRDGKEQEVRVTLEERQDS